MACSLRKPATWHAVVAVFLQVFKFVINGSKYDQVFVSKSVKPWNFQFFSWGVITAPMIKILNSEFGSNALLLNGIIMGVKGFLSFLSAPLIGALSDVYGRKLFLLVTAFFTCVPIPFIKVSGKAKQGLRPTWHAIETTNPRCHALSTFFPRFTQSRILSSWL